MSDVQFLPWLRTGLTVLGEDDASSGSIWLTPSVDVIVDDGTHSIDGPPIRMRGPGDVIALNPAEIKRRDPAPDSAEAETNFFCSVEFFAPDLPWRYSPVSPAGDRLAPWLALVVVELGEGVTITSAGGRLAVLHVDDPSAQLPDLADSWAWAHVQASTPLDDGVPQAYDADPGAFSSRLLCPRRLAPDTHYTACLVPAFVAGREAGLGHPPSTSLDPAWSSGRADLPIYDSWELTAGDRVDFKKLARRITPGELPREVGLRDLDLDDMGTGMTPLASAATFAGAMHAPSDGIVHWHDDADARQFETDVRRRLVTTPPTRPDSGDYDPLRHDPVVAPPAYGAPQIGTNVVPDSGTDRPATGRPPAVSLPPRRAGWFEELNIAPHHRAVAGLGTEVVRADQEALMAAAWEQGQAAIAANRTLNRGRLAEEAARQAERKWSQLADADAVSIAAPAFVQIHDDGPSLLRRLTDAEAPAAYFGAAFRRLGRAGGPLATRADLPAARAPAMAITRVVVASGRDPAGEVDDPLSIAFRRRYLPPGMDVGAAFPEPTDLEPFVPGEPIDGLDRTSRTELRRRAASIPIRPAGTPPRGRRRPDRATAGRAVSDVGGRRSVTIENIEFELPPWEFELDRPATHGLVPTTATASSGLGFDLAGEVRAAVRPHDAILTAVRSAVLVPTSLWSASAPIPTRIGLEPRFTDPMYERVRALSVDYLVPGVGAVPNNVAALLEVNPAYIDAFLAGLNHEMSRELRWREYPADLSQTWFQRFFDRVDPPGSVDIRPIADWGDAQQLGDEYARQGDTGPAPAPGLVLLIKADLIRKFPDVRVYAVPATLDDGERTPVVDGEIASPTFVGTLGRGVNFYGFDGLTEEEARGADGSEGWFFVLEEEPRAMRFGLDLGGRKGALPEQSWNSLGWRHLAEADGDVPWFCSIDPPNRGFEHATLDELTWGDGAATMAAITFRRPIQVFLHATAMLPGGSDG